MASLTFAIPCRNGARHLPALLESLLKQEAWEREGTGIQILLVDDASSDGSAELAREIAGKRISVHRNPRPLGIPGNWNRCASLVETEFFCLAHQDDVYMPTYARRMLEALAGDPEAVFAHCRAEALDEEGRVLPSPIERRKAAFFTQEDKAQGPGALSLLFEGNWINCPSMLFRTEAFRRLGAFDPRFCFVADWEYSFRVLLAGGRIRAVPECLLKYRRHSRQASQGAIEALDRYREELHLLDEVEARARALGGEWVPPRGRKAVRNNLLFDVQQDLLAGRRSLAKEKMRFGARELPGFRRDPLALGTGLLLPFGRLGGRILGLGIGLLVARMIHDLEPSVGGFCSRSRILRILW